MDVVVEGHLRRGDYSTERSLDELLVDALEECSADAAFHTVAKQCELTTQEVKEACDMLAALSGPDRARLLVVMGQEMVDALTDPDTQVCHSPATIAQALELWAALTPWVRSCLLDGQVDPELLDALTHAGYAQVMRQALQDTPGDATAS